MYKNGHAQDARRLRYVPQQTPSSLIQKLSQKSAPFKITKITVKVPAAKQSAAGKQRQLHRQQVEDKNKQV
jgi:hypothetical protein